MTGWLERTSCANIFAEGSPTDLSVLSARQAARLRATMLAALILAYHFKTDVVFLRLETKKTPDIDVNGVKWEIKSPKGNAKKTIENNLRTARKQSQNIVIDLARSKMHNLRAVARATFYIRTKAHNIKQLKIITKTQT